jgi:D-serine deaminase-like pyridoxal phosphate-dependent protein
VTLDAAQSADGSNLSLTEMTTPSLLVDLPTLEANIQAMTRRTADRGLELWPHAKTHKCAEIARLQLAHGATGITVATVAEAEFFAAAGVPRLLLSYPPVGRWRVDRLVALARHVDLTVTVDDAATLATFDRGCERAGVGAHFLWEIDSGLGRCGTAPGAITAQRVAEVVPRLTNLRFAGLLTFGGHVYRSTRPSEIEAIAADELQALRTTARELATRGLEAEVLSFGSTPAAHHLPQADLAGLQIRPGNYVFYDVSQIALEVTTAASCALTVLARVVSHPGPDHLVLDCGSKALSTDRMSDRVDGFGIVVDHPELRIERLFEEHAIVAVRGHSDLQLGDLVRVIPNHACATLNLHAQIQAVAGDIVRETWTIGARAWTDSPFTAAA